MWDQGLVAQDPLRKILRILPKRQVQREFLGNVLDLTSGTLQTVQLETTLNAVLLNHVEDSPKIDLVRIECIPIAQKGSRIDLGIRTETKLTGELRELDHFVIRQVDAIPGIRNSENTVDVGEELPIDDFGNILGRLRMREAQVIEDSTADHEAVRASQAEDAEQQVESAGMIVGVDENDAGTNAAQLLIRESERAMRQNDSVLDMLRSVDLATGLPSVFDLPAKIGQRTQIFLRADELILRTDTGRRRDGKQGRDGQCELFVAHGVNLRL